MISPLPSKFFLWYRVVLALEFYITGFYLLSKLNGVKWGRFGNVWQVNETVNITED